ncbi:hypothetical protein H7J07_08575 [Mycobacterium koreense]|uniref:hypothetical protein n=1 Tax=Mycolicibacillus koreensis TaxID=1069220 RepID=UPI000848B321|nr:hypothetical protein [Mycolicibacillus koreensis]MCV7248272.1 hypothetical protein [Mycolicibacillus koreensis]ODR09485.1 hypothetical protein BHQ15_06830 [Mycolicibacillus koreensis]BBY55211.1 hypothetical protein MKOR_24620 [Mycolicibacillus koreensis]
MTPRQRTLIDLGVSAVALVGGVLAWTQVSTVIAVAPLMDGQPVTESTVYDPQLVMVALLLVTLAAVLAVTGVARWRRTRRPHTP